MRERYKPSLLQSDQCVLTGENRSGVKNVHHLFEEILIYVLMKTLRGLQYMTCCSVDLHELRLFLSTLE